MARNFADEPFVGQLKLSLPPLNAKAIPLMTADQVNKVPPPLLSWIWSVASQVQDLDEITIVTVADESCHPKIQWVIQWILHGEEASFFARGKSEVVRMDDKNNRRVVSYDSETHARDVGWRATAETHAWFEELAEVYQFSVFAGLTDLRAALSERLCSRFPVYVPEIITFFKKLYDNDVFVSVSWRERERERSSQIWGGCCLLLTCGNFAAVLTDPIRRRAREIRRQSCGNPAETRVQRR